MMHRHGTASHRSTPSRRGGLQTPSFEQARRDWYHWFQATKRGAEAMRRDPKGFAHIMWKTWSPEGLFEETQFNRVAKSFQNDGGDFAFLTLALGRGKDFRRFVLEGGWSFCASRGARSCCSRADSALFSVVSFTDATIWEMERCRLLARRVISRQRETSVLSEGSGHVPANEIGSIGRE
jgi:hypothetical protein